MNARTENTRLGVIKSDDVSYSYVFIDGQCLVTVWDDKDIVLRTKFRL